MPTVLKGYETPESRPPRDESYVMIMNAIGRLSQASSTPTIPIQDMVAYHGAFEIVCRLGWFIDAVQMVERVRMGINLEPTDD